MLALHSSAIAWWIKYPLSVILILWCFQQVRMAMIYQGKIYSPTIGDISDPSGSMTAIAACSSARSLVYAIILLTSTYPSVIFHLSIAWLVFWVVKDIAHHATNPIKIAGALWSSLVAFVVRAAIVWGIWMLF